MKIELTAQEKGILRSLLDHVQGLLVWQEDVKEYVADYESFLFGLDADEKAVFDRLCKKLAFKFPEKPKHPQLSEYPLGKYHTCQFCGKTYQIAKPADWIRQYCSTACRNKARYQRSKARKEQHT